MKYSLSDVVKFPKAFDVLCGDKVVDISKVNNRNDTYVVMPVGHNKVWLVNEQGEDCANFAQQLSITLKPIPFNFGDFVRIRTNTGVAYFRVNNIITLDNKEMIEGWFANTNRTDRIELLETMNTYDAIFRNIEDA